MKVHLMRSTRSTWCGRETVARRITVTRDKSRADCKTCLKADAAEQRKEDAASR